MDIGNGLLLKGSVQWKNQRFFTLFYFSMLV